MFRKLAFCKKSLMEVKMVPREPTFKDILEQMSLLHFVVLNLTFN